MSVCVCVFLSLLFRFVGLFACEWSAKSGSKCDVSRDCPKECATARKRINLFGVLILLSLSSSLSLTFALSSLYTRVYSNQYTVQT